MKRAFYVAGLFPMPGWVEFHRNRDWSTERELIFLRLKRIEWRSQLFLARARAVSR